MLGGFLTRQHTRSTRKTPPSVDSLYSAFQAADADLERQSASYPTSCGFESRPRRSERVFDSASPSADNRTTRPTAVGDNLRRSRKGCPSGCPFLFRLGPPLSLRYQLAQPDPERVR